MHNTQTRTSTYTQTDVRKTFESLKADLLMISDKTDKWDQDYVSRLYHDIYELGRLSYLRGVSIVLQDSSGQDVRAVKYEILSDGSASSGDAAGKNTGWRSFSTDNLKMILHYTDKEISSEIKQSLKIDWSRSTIDTSFPSLSSENAQLYANNGYEMQKQDFR